MSPTTIQPGRIWYVVPLLVACVSVLLVPLALLKVVTGRKALAFQFTVPGQKEFEIEVPGKYVLWNETETIFEGRTYSSSTTLPDGMQIKLVNLETQMPVQLSAAMGGTVAIGQDVRHSVGNFQITEPGRYRISVDGQFPSRVFYFRESMLREVRSIFRAVLLAMMGMMAALFLGVLIFLKRRATRPEPQMR